MGLLGQYIFLAFVVARGTLTMATARYKLHDIHIWYMGLLIGQFDFLVFMVVKGTLLPWQQFLTLYQVSQQSIHS